MATLIKSTVGTWKAIIRKRGWPPTFKNFRTKRDAQDWARRTADEMVRGVYINRADAERMTLAVALKRYSEEVTVTKSVTTAQPERNKARRLLEHLGDYSLAAITPNIIANYRDSRLATGLSNDTVRLELALLSHVYTIAIKEWRLGLTYTQSPIFENQHPVRAAIDA